VRVAFIQSYLFTWVVDQVVCMVGIYTELFIYLGGRSGSMYGWHLYRAIYLPGW
jgi:hypothetical protein